MNKQYIDLMGTDFTEWMTSPEQIALFEKMCELEALCKRPINECYREVVEVLNLEAQIKGRPKKAYIQAGPGLN
jgi:hypothetical protein